MEQVWLSSHGGGGGVLKEEAGIQEKDRGYQHDNAYRAPSPAELALSLLLGLLLTGESFLVSPRFAGCDSIFSLS